MIKRRFGLDHSIGHTPLVELANLDINPRVQVLAKLEGINPGGSIKDRPALYMIQKAESEGLLSKDKIIVEPTSGNMGIPLAMLGAARGYRVKLFMPECVSIERQHIIQAFGAEVVLSPAAEATDGAIRMAHELVEQFPEEHYMPNQFSNPANILSHYETTGPEIYSQTEGEVEYFVAGMGTTGTLMGTGKYLKEQNSSVKIIGLEPSIGHTIQGLKNMTESIVPAIYSPGDLDEKLTVEDDDAFEMTRLLARNEGLFVGMSSGAAVAGAVQLAKTLKKGKIVCILPDRGDRYLSTVLFRSICARCPP